MRALVAFERSGRVRDALIAVGIDAVSCDLEPTDSPGPHIQGDAYPLLRQPWDLIVAHPVCRYLANSGARWLTERPERWALMREDAERFLACLNANAPFVAVENSIQHKHAQAIIGRRQDFTTQPWMFGDNVKKRSCWWAKNLPRLKRTSDLDGSTAYPKCHREPPGPDRARKRAETEPGIADAIARQWGLYVAEHMRAAA